MAIPYRARFYLNPQKPDLSEHRALALAIKNERGTILEDDRLMITHAIQDLCARIEELQMACAEQDVVIDG